MDFLGDRSWLGDGIIPTGNQQQPQAPQFQQPQQPMNFNPGASAQQDFNNLFQQTGVERWLEQSMQPQAPQYQQPQQMPQQPQVQAQQAPQTQQQGNGLADLEAQALKLETEFNEVSARLSDNANYRNADGSTNLDKLRADSTKSNSLSTQIGILNRKITSAYQQQRVQPQQPTIDTGAFQRDAIEMLRVLDSRASHLPPQVRESINREYASIFRDMEQKGQLSNFTTQESRYQLLRTAYENAAGRVVSGMYNQPRANGFGAGYTQAVPTQSPYGYTPPQVNPNAPTMQMQPGGVASDMVKEYLAKSLTKGMSIAESRRQGADQLPGMANQMVDQRTQAYQQQQAYQQGMQNPYQQPLVDQANKLNQYFNESMRRNQARRQEALIKAGLGTNPYAGFSDY